MRSISIQVPKVAIWLSRLCTVREAGVNLNARAAVALRLHYSTASGNALGDKDYENKTSYTDDA